MVSMWLFSNGTKQMLSTLSPAGVNLKVIEVTPTSLALGMEAGHEELLWTLTLYFL